MRKKFFGALLTACMLILLTATALAADRSDWTDRNYNFRAIDSAYLPSLNCERAGLDSDIVARELNEMYLKEARTPGFRMFFDGGGAVNSTITINVELVEYKIVERLIPAHWETRYKKEKMRYKKDGKWHDGEIEVPYQEYVPDKYVNDSLVTMRFRVFDTSSGKEVFLRDESRLHSDSTNRKGVFGRICKTFFNDLKKKMK